MSADALWGFMESSGIKKADLRKFFAARGAKLIEKGHKPDYPKQYGEAVREAREKRPAVKRSTPKSANQWLDEAEAK